MSLEKKESQENIKHEGIKYSLERRIKVLKLLDSIPRFRIISMLLIFRKISLSNLSKLLKRAKSTLSHHIKKLEASGALQSSRKEARGFIDEKIFELIPLFIEKFDLKLEDNDHLEETQKREIMNLSIKNDVLFFNIIKLLIEQSNLYYEAIIENDLKPKLEPSEDVQQENFKKLNYNYWFLSDEAHKKYKELSKQFNSQIEAIIEQDKSNNNEKLRPNFVLHAFFPFMQIIEYDSELKTFRKFMEI